MTWDNEDEERFERAMEHLKHLEAAHEAKALEELAANQEGEDDGRIAPNGPPRPLFWHPWYRDKTFLIDWLNSNNMWPYRIPLARRVRYDAGEPIMKNLLHQSVVTLTKQVAAGRAPYVGRPFCYRWCVATDELGRSIASEARIVYLPGA